MSMLFAAAVHDAEHTGMSEILPVEDCFYLKIMSKDFSEVLKWILKKAQLMISTYLRVPHWPFSTTTNQS